MKRMGFWLLLTLVVGTVEAALVDRISRFTVPPDPFAEDPVSDTTDPSLEDRRTRPVITQPPVVPAPVQEPERVTLRPTPPQPLTLARFLGGVQKLAGIQVTIDAPESLLTQEALTVRVNVANACRLTVLAIGQDNSQTLLFPNAAQPEDSVAAGQVTVLSEQSGVSLQTSETLVALCRPLSAPAANFDFSQGDLIHLPKSKILDSQLNIAGPLAELGEWGYSQVTLKDYKIRKNTD